MTLTLEKSLDVVITVRKYDWEDDIDISFDFYDHQSGDSFGICTSKKHKEDENERVGTELMSYAEDLLEEIGDMEVGENA